MTARLIGFMSVLLFLSLAAFGLIMNQSREAVLNEVRHTVSFVGSKTLAAFAGDLVADGPQQLDLRVTEAVDRRGPDAGGPATPADPPLSATTESPEVKEQLDRIRARLAAMRKDAPGDPSDGKGAFVVLRMERHGAIPCAASAPADSRSGFPSHSATPASSPASAPSMPVAPDATFYFASGEVRVDGDKNEGMRVNIPVFRPGGDDIETALVVEPPPGRHDWMLKSPDGVFDELMFDVPTTEYRSLFDAIAKRSLFVFLGVFVVGTVLSAGIARRFTRPIRRLDDGLRRISEGALDVRVDVKGDDEVARLSRAFNDMAGRLEAAHARESELQRRDKLSALGRLAAGVAHDVRNPLQSINLTLRHIEETGRPDAPAKSREFERGVSLIRSEIHRLDQLVANFLRFARSDRAELVAVEPRTLLEETAALVSKEAERRGVRVRVAVDDGTPSVHGNADSLRSALLNLVLNGFEAMDEGGELDLVAKRAAAGRVTIEVTDTGRGIPEEDRERVFEFGFTTRDGGHGLGLAMVHHVVVEEHGGRIDLSSEAGRGTTFVLELPESRA